MSEEHRPDQNGVPRWLTEREAGAWLNLSVKWLQKQRLLGHPPRYAKFGGAIRYGVADLEAYEQACLRESTSEPPARSHPHSGSRKP